MQIQTHGDKGDGRLKGCASVFLEPRQRHKPSSMVEVDAGRQKHQDSSHGKGCHSQDIFIQID